MGLCLINPVRVFCVSQLCKLS